MSPNRPHVPSGDVVVQRIHLIRGAKVVIDSDLAQLYGVSTKRFNEQFRRNARRFPADFAFRLTPEEAEALRSQFATSNRGRGGRRSLPYVFTEHGAIMAASMLNTFRAIQVSVFVVRAFVQLREAATSQVELAKRLDELESRIEKGLTKHDRAIAQILAAIRELMGRPGPSGRPIGFVTPPGS